MYAPEDSYKLMQLNKVFNVGIYVRLSREDEKSSESESIANQKEFLIRHVSEQGWNLIDIFTDDGYTGTNFNRPGFQRLIKAIENKKINLVITKDLSRLGRDYIDTGYYVERYFPERNVRYIALNDGVDTFLKNSNNDMTPFKSVMNDLYSKDISNKVRTTANLKRKNGEFIGSFAPYGYLKDPCNKNKLIVDHAAAWVVRKIYDMFVNGAGLLQISMALNQEGIPSPGAYKKQTTNYKGRGGDFDLWSFESVKYILTNPTYAGNVTQNRYTKVNHKVKKLTRVPREAWITVNNTHEPIIDSDTFEHAQHIIGVRDYSKKYAPKDGAHLLSGMIFCGDCGSRMTFATTTAGRFYAICTRYKNYRKCTRHSIPEKELEFSVISELKKISSDAIDFQKLCEKAQKLINTSEDDPVTHEAKKIESRLSEITKIIRCIYEDKVKEVITESDFLNFTQDYNMEREKLNFRLSKLLNDAQKKPSHKKDTGNIINMVKEFTDFNNVTKPMLIKLIDRIEVFEQREITIKYRFTNPY